MERQRYTAQPDRANRHRKLAALVLIGSEAKSASQGTQSATQLLAERAGHPGGVAAVRNPVLSRAKRGDMRGKYMIS